MSQYRRRIKEIYEAALAHPVRLRAAFLIESCAGDPDLRRQIEELLGQDASGATASLGQHDESLQDPAPIAIGAGSRLGPYELLSTIGAGGMGQVFRGRDTRLGRLVAVKISHAGFSDRFAREARVIASLNHRNICTLYDVGPNYLVMELVEGQILKGPLPAQQALRYGFQLAAALEAAHRKGITHRDLKPANILVTEDGVKLLDFGLAKVAGRTSPSEETQTASLTEAGAVIGTVAYMSPEQTRGEEADERSDIFSFGLVIYEALSGRRAFQCRSTVETMSAILRDEPPPLDAPPPVQELIRRCLRKAPEERFQTMGAVRTAIEEAVTGGAASGMMRHSLAQPPRPKQPSLAVLPFANLSADKENEYFSDGLAEEILNLMAKAPNLKVIARTSSFAFRGKEQDIRNIASALDVENILEGSVRRSGNRIRVSAQLIQASDGVQLWAERYDRDMTDVFEIQDEIGQAISSALQVRLAPRKRVVNVEAWEHVLKGIYHRARNSPEQALKAKEEFERAVEIDPAYPEAYSGLAFTYYLLATFGVKPAAEMNPMARAAAEKALEIDPSDSESHAVLAVLAGVHDHDWETAASRHALSLQAGQISPRAHLTYALYTLLAKNRADEAVEQSRLAVKLDPLSVLFHYGLVWCLALAGQTGEALASARQTLEIDSNHHLAWNALGIAQLLAGMPDEAVASFRRVVELAPWNHLGPGSLATALVYAGNASAAADLARNFPRPEDLNFGHALYYAAAGDSAATFEALESAYRRRDIYLHCVKLLPMFDPYRTDPRYVNLLRRMNLS
jgi:serine/threonine-protein kinase